jgi:hypothetical protein
MKACDSVISHREGDFPIKDRPEVSSLSIPNRWSQPLKRVTYVSEADLKRAARQLQEHLEAQKAARTVTPVDFGARKAEEGLKAVHEQGGVVPPQ